MPCTGSRTSSIKSWAVVEGFVFLVVLMLNTGQLEVHADILPACPPEEQVIQNYEQLIERGDIRDWRAMCKKVTFDDQGT